MKCSKPTIYDPNFLPDNVYSGVPSWLNLSVAECKEDLGRLDTVVSGVPWEGGCTISDYSSTTEGPKGIRSVSIRYTGFFPDFNLGPFDYLKAAGFGDAACQNGDYDFTFRQVRERVITILDAGVVPLTFGGDHGIALPIVSEIAKRHPKCVGILHFDAHLDNYTCLGNDLCSRCSPFYRLHEGPNMDPSKVVHINTRGPRSYREEFNNAQKFGANVILGREVKENGWKASIDRVIELTFEDTDFVYATICSDAPDATSMPQGPQDMGGLTLYELCMMVYEAGLAGAKGFDFVEIYPDTSSLQTVAHDACWAALYYLNGYAERKKNDGK